MENEEIEIQYSSTRLIERRGTKPKAQNTYKVKPEDPEEQEPNYGWAFFILMSIVVLIVIAFLW